MRQVDVDLNFLLVLYSTVGLYRLVCLSIGETGPGCLKVKTRNITMNKAHTEKRTHFGITETNINSHDKRF